ncbi:SAM-dependent methyltransferase [Halorhabdus sp. SVX81]|uniref:class I SAM-dependent methyltransferase n=1 Tax=Halorhabdus sp. SVX81 TaxID=2978283 RepID=UPI0023DB84B6|nr:methyltransferase domain-containing protein [Halorhabdus sp. SVX81]WEL17311.1 SAM-dependent methyltransferase [Halorhabdus sp. SVX81]
MGHHTFDADRADALEDDSRYAYLSVDELLGLFDFEETDCVVDLGSGTGFYTRSVAAHVDAVLAIDIQPAMHAAFEAFGRPGNVHRVTASIDGLPVDTDAVSAAYSTMTYHEFVSERALDELTRAIEPGGRVAIADWSADGTGDRGPPLAERYDAATVAEHLREHGFAIDTADERRETLVVSARYVPPSA